MEQRPLGRCGLWVGRLALGTGTWTRGTDEYEARDLLAAFLDAGGTLVDTADGYADGGAESLLGELLEELEVRDQVVLSTKAGAVPGTQRRVDTSRAHLLRSLDTSLRRLRTDVIDLWHVNAWDPWTPLEETLAAVDSAVASGKVRYVGVSNFSGWQMARAATMQQAMGRTPLVTTQVEYSLLEREIGLLLYRVKIGQPKSEGLLKLLENPEHLRLMNQAELSLHADQKKVELYAQKEHLFFAIDEKSHEADLTEKGRNFLSPKDPDAFMLPDLTTALHEIDNGPEPDARKRLEAKAKLQQDFETKAQRIHAISQLLKAYCLYQKDVQYVVQDNKVIIVDENTGRLMTGRRWSDGLHQAVEAKEGVAIERETQTLATITIQNYFRLYHKLAGMTGTAETEASEFHDIYKLGVLVIPTNKPVARKDANDSVYKTRREKYNAVLKEIKDIHAQGRPILVGTISVEVSEHLSRMLKREGIVHSVLNAKYHQQEAEIVARAGQRGAVGLGLFDQPAEPDLAGRLGEPDPRAELGDRDPAVFPEDIEDLAVQRVQIAFIRDFLRLLHLSSPNLKSEWTSG